MSFLDLDERLIDLAARVELCASPLTDYKDFPEADITLVEGAVANEEHLEQIQRRAPAHQDSGLAGRLRASPAT